MRFRSVDVGQSLLWIGSSMLWIFSTAFRLHHLGVSHQPGLKSANQVALVCWSIVFLLWLGQFFFGRIEFEQDGIRSRGIIRSTRIPYSQIVGIRPVLNSRGKQNPKQIELETARLSADIYPHDYLVIAVSDPSAVLHAIHDKVPTAEYEPFSA